MLSMQIIQRFYTYLMFGVLALLLMSCGQKETATQAGSPIPAMPVSVIAVEPTSVPIQTEVVAQTEGAKEVEIRPRVGGILVKKLFEEGAPIKEGQVMFKIDPVPYQLATEQAQAQLAQQKARITQTQRESSRLKGLLETQSISEREYDNAVSDQAATSASVLQYEAQLREAQLNLSYTTVKAPSSGIAGRFLLSEGALVAANTSLLTTVVQISPIWVRFSLSESELTALGGHLDEKKVKAIHLILPDGSLYAENGKLNFSSSQIDPTLGTQQLRAEFANVSRQLLPGQFVRVQIATGSREGVFLVPQTAVMTGEQGKFVYVVEKDVAGKTVAGVRPITENGWQGNQWVVLSGLKQGDKVLTDNLIKIRPGSEIAPHAQGEMPANTPTKKKA
jgi:membrane fusion protein (multidrug efflux system)